MMHIWFTRKPLVAGAYINWLIILLIALKVAMLIMQSNGWNGGMFPTLRGSMVFREYSTERRVEMEVLKSIF